MKTPIPYSIAAVTKVRVARLSMPHWVEFLERHAEVKLRFEYEVMRLMSEVMAHTITLHLLDAPGRLARFMRNTRICSDAFPRKSWLPTSTSRRNAVAPQATSRLSGLVFIFFRAPRATLRR